MLWYGYCDCTVVVNGIVGPSALALWLLYIYIGLAVPANTVGIEMCMYVTLPPLRKMLILYVPIILTSLKHYSNCSYHATLQYRLSTEFAFV